ncbi:hypothetical protein PAXINDRAFT_20147 [Paxillus involutus ATCC 200175]|uniref:Unplaced genomic scaffold PAXINscaffold_899, whole genome shotgun sequence n=1 Tax=Paxillus involutus ATCC 200175 TaxID=664439 RepID=A0A0C9T5X4_PAXIN|nr:hypothetical protein PAXINDRAFT_20147 [Paxillus involutus ATCC 200175]
MGRPKLYKTPEERVLAARSYRSKYYESHRDVINTNITIKRRAKRVQKIPRKEPPSLIGGPGMRGVLARRAGRPRTIAKVTPATGPSLDTHLENEGSRIADSISQIEGSLKEITGALLVNWQSHFSRTTFAAAVTLISTARFQPRNY